jgi:hypothetical protein
MGVQLHNGQLLSISILDPGSSTVVHEINDVEWNLGQPHKLWSILLSISWWQFHGFAQFFIFTASCSLSLSGLIWRRYLRRRRCVRTEAHRSMAHSPICEWDNSVFYVPVANATEFTFHGQSAWNAIVFYSDYYKPSEVTWIGPCLENRERGNNG